MRYRRTFVTRHDALASLEEITPSGNARPNYQSIEAKSAVSNKANAASNNNLVSLGQAWLVTTP